MFFEYALTLHDCCVPWLILAYYQWQTLYPEKWAKMSCVNNTYLEYYVTVLTGRKFVWHENNSPKISERMFL